jgi:hypothetical protein
LAASSRGEISPCLQAWKIRGNDRDSALADDKLSRFSTGVIPRLRYGGFAYPACSSFSVPNAVLIIYMVAMAGNVAPAQRESAVLMQTGQIFPC